MFIPLEKHPSSWPSFHGGLDTSFSVRTAKILFLGSSLVGSTLA
jgi:hypothetical protein